MSDKSTRIKQGFVLREVAGSYVAIATGQASRGFNGMIKLNETGKEIWNSLEQGLPDDQIAMRLTKLYQASADQAVSDVQAFVEQAQKEGFLVS